MRRHTRPVHLPLLTVAMLLVWHLVAPTDLFATTITVDGDSVDWTLAEPVANVGHIHRTVALGGFYVWRDASGDERTDISLGSPDPTGDIERFAITSDSTHLYFLVETGSGMATVAAPPQVQVLIDTDRVPSSGNTYLMGFADTDIGGDAAWEYAVVTRFGSGTPTPRVWNAGNVDVASGASSNVRLNNVIEVAVAWSDLGFTGAPTSPIRFSVAMLHADVNDNAVDIGGAAISNVVDVVTHYGTPGSTANSWIELTDGVIDYSFDVYFHLDPDTEPSSPMLIVEVAYDTNLNGEEFFEVVNVSDTELELSGYRVADEETIGGGEGAFVFPTRMLAAAQRLVVASQADQFLALHNRYPHFELTDTHPMVDVLTRDASWGTGNLLFSNSGDELLLTDAHDTILDVVTWESGVYPGVVPASAVAKGSTIERATERRDTNDASADFVASMGTPRDGSSPCITGSMGTRTAGVACDDNDSCTTGETCDALGMCGAGGVVLCVADGDACTSDLCNDVFTGCYGPEAGGTACDDADVCTINDVCDGQGGCLGPNPLDCSGMDGVCLVGVCDTNQAGCVAVEAADGDACTSDLCSTGMTCAAGTCVGGTPVDCSASGDQCNAGVCDSTTGTCGVLPVTSGTPCDDGDPCTGGEVCQSGRCYGGAYVCGGDDPPDVMETPGALDRADRIEVVESVDVMESGADTMEPTADLADVGGDVADPLPDLEPGASGSDGCGCSTQRPPSQIPWVLILLAVPMLWFRRRYPFLL